MAWLYLIIASFGEIFGVMFINLYVAHMRLVWLLSLIAVFTAGFFFLYLVMHSIALRAAYVIWPELDDAFAVIIGILFLHEYSIYCMMFFIYTIFASAGGCV